MQVAEKIAFLHIKRLVAVSESDRRGSIIDYDGAILSVVRKADAG